MKPRAAVFIAGAALAAALIVAGQAVTSKGDVVQVDTAHSATDDVVHQMTVRYAPGVNPVTEGVPTGNTLIAGVELVAGRLMKNNIQELRFSEPLDGAQAQKVSAALEKSGLVEFADVMYPLIPNTTGSESIVCTVAGGVTPNDACLANQQWWLDVIGAPAVWADAEADTAPSSPIIVGVIDTGKTAHPDLDGKWLGGYDFIGASSIYNPLFFRYDNVDGFTSGGDGDGRDADATDEGNGQDGSVCHQLPYNIFTSQWAPVDAANSTWHGTGAAGIIAANRNNTIGASGITPNVKIQPIRVLGKCIASDDSMNLPDAIDWAAGVAVTGAGTNPNPVDVINMSLGSLYPTADSCPTVYQEAINRALARGVVVVASAGNDANAASRHVPSACAGVISVGATTRANTLASYSNTDADVSAPGGRTNVAYSDGILSLRNSGSIGVNPSGYIYKFVQGTSSSAPMVSAAVAAVLTKYPSLRSDLGAPAKIKAALKYAAAASTQCTGCGAGILHIPTLLSTLSSTATPSIPQNVSAGLVWNGSLNVSWDAPVTAQWSPITSYTANAYSAATGGTLLDSCTSTSERSCVLENTTAGTSYHISVTATFNAQTSAATARVQKTALRQAAAPTGVAVTAGPEKAAVTWTNPTDMGDDSGFLTEAKAFLAQTGGEKVTWCYGNSTGPGECELTLLTAGTTYWVEVAVMTQYFPYGRASGPRVAVVPASVPTTTPPVTQAPATTAPATTAPATTAPATKAASGTGAAAGTTTVPSTQQTVKTVAVKVGKVMTPTAALKAVQVKIPAGAKFTTTVPSQSKKVCQVTKGNVKIVGKGTCVVTVKITPKKGKATSTKVTLKS
jgi:serine protease